MLPSVQRRYADFTEYVNGTEGESYAASLAREQSGFLASLNNSSIEYELRHSYTSVVNGVSLVVRDEDVSAIASLSCVKNIIYSEVYAVPQATVTENVVNVYDTGIYDSSEIEYQGEGMLIAVLDTGYDRNHSAFQEMPPEGTEKLSREQVEAQMDNLAASTQGAAITVDDVYYNAKVPFAYDYADDAQTWFSKVKELAASLGFAAEMRDYKANPEAYRGSVADVAEVLRIAVTGKANSPDLWTIMRILGDGRARERVAQAINS